MDESDAGAARLRQKEVNLTWTAALLNRYMRIMLNNAYHCWKSATGADPKSSSLSAFTLHVCQGLLAEQGCIPPAGDPAVCARRGLDQIRALHERGVSYSLLHWPERVSWVKRCALRHCTRLSVWRCPACKGPNSAQVALCRDDCFKKFHEIALRRADPKIITGPDDVSSSSESDDESPSTSQITH